jgi:hypothetical protein
LRGKNIHKPPVIILDGNQRSALAATRSLGRKGIDVVVGAEKGRSLASSSSRDATGSPRGRVRDPNGWAIWLEESGKLREYVRSCLASEGLLDETRADGYFREIASGRTRGGEKLFHLSRIPKWMTLSISSH